MGVPSFTDPNALARLKRSREAAERAAGIRTDIDAYTARNLPGAESSLRGAMSAYQGGQGVLGRALSEAKPMAERAKQNAEYAGTFDSADFNEVGGNLGVIGDVLGTPFGLFEKAQTGLGDILGTRSAHDREKAKAYIDSFNANFGGSVQPREYNTGNETIDAIRGFNRPESADLAYGVGQIDAMRNQHKDAMAAFQAAAAANASLASAANASQNAATGIAMAPAEGEKSLAAAYASQQAGEGARAAIPGTEADSGRKQLVLNSSDRDPLSPTYGQTSAEMARNDILRRRNNAESLGVVVDAMKISGVPMSPELGVRLVNDFASGQGLDYSASIDEGYIWDGVKLDPVAAGIPEAPVPTPAPSPEGGLVTAATITERLSPPQRAMLLTGEDGVLDLVELGVISEAESDVLLGGG